MQSWLRANPRQQGGIKQLKNAQQGAVLPILVLFMAIFAALLLGLTQMIHSSAQELNLSEATVHKHMQSYFSEAIQFNAIANNNLEMANQLEKMLSSLEQLLAWGFNLAATTPLWESKLPIPEKYDLISRIEHAITPILERINELSERQREHKASLKMIPASAVVQLNLLESLCALSCFRKNPSLASSPQCHQLSTYPNDCHLRIKVVGQGWIRHTSIPLKSLLNTALIQKGGFSLLNPHQLPKERLHQPSARVSPSEVEPRDVHIGVVHPRLCAATHTDFRIPCSAGYGSFKTAQARLFALSFEPHWSVAVEF